MITKEEWDDLKKEEPYSLYLDSMRRIERIEEFLEKEKPNSWNAFKAKKLEEDDERLRKAQSSPDKSQE